MASSDDSLSDQRAEIDALKVAFSGKVKVISNIGEFTHVVSVQPAEFDLQLKFQLTETYPTSCPVISVKSSTLTTDQIGTLTTTLSEKRTSEGNPLALIDLASYCNTWLLDNNIDTTAASQTHEQGTKQGDGKRKGKNKPKKGKAVAEESVYVGKLPPMKTALDVINRLQWDKAVDKHCFIVGYMDRLVGLVERAFVDFTWEDLASVDHFALAIPQHRIQYFKYKDEKVWDKNERLDSVFGSTGSAITIVEAVESYEAKLRQAAKAAEKADPEDEAVQDAGHVQDAGAVAGDSSKGTEGDINKHANETKKEKNETDVDQLKDNTERDEIQKLMVPEGGTNTGQTAESALTDQDTPDPRFERTGKCNYFVAFHITDWSVLDNINKVQKELLSIYPQYEPYTNAENGMHVTLNAMALDNIRDLQNCVIAMNKIKQELTQLAQRARPVEFKGVGHFGSKVVFAKVDAPQELYQMSELIYQTLHTEGVRVEKRALKPHLTIFHVKRSAEWEDFKIDVGRYRKYEFGHQAIDNVQVCQMGTLPEMKDWQPGWYTTIFSLRINKW